MDNKKMNPLLVIFLVILGLNILGFLFNVLVQTAIVAIVILGAYLLYEKFFKKPGSNSGAE